MVIGESTTAAVARTWRVAGQVQGVGFRPFIHRLATELELGGTVRNDPSGVTIEAWGPVVRLDELERRIRRDAPPLARIDELRRLTEQPAPPDSPGFAIIASDHDPAQRGRVTVDSAVCADCRREMLDPADRRCGHALINCTNCGPRYTIVRDLPYDRPRTTMAHFPMCPACASEYGDPADRRFHAQPTCCPACGPQVKLLNGEGAPIEGEPIAAAAGLLRGGRILAMKGLGGYHLVVDACNEEAVLRLRRVKGRDHKPFAVMARDLESARGWCGLSEAAEALLSSPICPIVLAPRRDAAAAHQSGQAADAAIAGSVAMACHRFGLMLPYTPMQHLLLAETALAGRAVVMTSANESDDPLIKDDDDALNRLRGICDAFLVHDRPIERAVDDSIVIDAPRGIVPIRRARGYVPAPLSLPVAAPRPGLCVGGELKNAVAVVRADHAVLSQHIGDLTYALAYRRFERTIDDLKRLFDVEPQWVACDLHPAYLSQRYARRLAKRRSLDLIAVQHHHAHLASLLAEHGRTDRIVGLVCDGVGYGDDGAAWGGEVLAGDLRGYERLGRLRPLRLPGGDAAARQTGRCALSWLADALGSEAIDHRLARRALPDDRQRAAVRELLAGDLNCPPSSGMGRLFDAAAALLGLCDYNHYEAMSGLMLESAAARAASRPSGDDVVPVIDDDEQEGLFQLDQRPLLRRLVELTEEGTPTEALAWFFHDALAEAMSRAARRAAEHAGVTTVGLTGGVLCNTLLSELAVRRLEAAGLAVLLHRAVSPNDGSIAYGQAAVAAATLAARSE